MILSLKTFPTALPLYRITLAYANTIKGEHDLAVKQCSQTRLMMNAIMNTPAGDRPMTEEDINPANFAALPYL